MNELINHHPIHYSDADSVAQQYAQLDQQPGLVTPTGILALQNQLAAAAAGQAFVLHAGHCAESFADCAALPVTSLCNMLAALASEIEMHRKQPVILIGRLAGQMAKPRTQLTEVYQQQQLPTYQGALINAHPFDSRSRQPDPKRLTQAYTYSHQAYQHLQHWSQTQQRPIWISHEALHLPYEHCFTRPWQDQVYNVATHLPWIGMRTAFLDSAHTHYLSTLANPIALKVGPDLSPTTLSALVNQLNPNKLPGHLTLIHRLGAQAIKTRLPHLIAAVQATGIPVLWSCDPMHGNTRRHNGQKLRHLADIETELRLATRLHQQHGSTLAGLHLECTAEPVWECSPLPHGQASPDKPIMDPRLNHNQALTLLQSWLDNRPVQGSTI